MLFRKEYYCLVAGLKEYTLDSDRKGFDAPALIAEIKEDLSRRDRRTVELLYTYYDIENLIGLRAGREHFSRLGNLSREELQEELLAPSRLPASLGRVIAAFNAADKEGAGADVGEDADMEQSFERNLFAAYYAECARSSSQFLRRWSAFDRTLRNVAAAFAARRRGSPVAEVVVGTGDIESALARSSAADFGIKGEVAYVDQVMQAVSDAGNLVEKENRMDAIRWNMAEELTLTNYFDLDFILGYLVRVNIIHRWTALDPQRGREMLHRLVEGLTERGTRCEMQTDKNKETDI